MKPGGVVAAGHSATAHAAAEVLRAGGNAFDAVIAAHFAACIAEPVLCSLGGGGFLTASRAGAKPVVYDFFTQTPLQKKPLAELDFYPITADFGTAQQEFHIGCAAAGTPGSVAGLFAIHRELGSLPMTRLVEPAMELARNGVAVNAFQAYIFSIVAPIYLSTPAARQLFTDPQHPEQILQSGHLLVQREQADFLEHLAREGEALFYQGEIAAQIDQLGREHGGYLSRADLQQYQVIKREPLEIPYRDTRVYINPPPSSGGLLIAFALELLGQLDLSAYPAQAPERLELLAAVMDLTHEARIAAQIDGGFQQASQLLNPDYLQRYQQQIRHRAKALRGTTHISVIDTGGNVASMTLSNGEGCGVLIPGTGIMLNNMLGEEDLNHGGFHQWQTDQRMTSMMAPAIVLCADGREIAIGSGGSNRIRSAILQVLSQLIDHQLPVEQAVAAPRIHLERDLLNIEGGFAPEQLTQLVQAYPRHCVWEDLNLFFGGAHTVVRDRQGFSGSGDPRRGGVCVQVKV
ncbi:MAG: gamma-glutamyltransferase [Thiolinea sp.]